MNSASPQTTQETPREKGHDAFVSYAEEDHESAIGMLEIAHGLGISCLAGSILSGWDTYASGYQFVELYGTTAKCFFLICGPSSQWLRKSLFQFARTRR